MFCPVPVLLNMGTIWGNFAHFQQNTLFKKLIRSITPIFGLELVNIVFLLYREFELDKDHGSGDIWDTGGPSQKYKLVGQNRNFKFVWEILSQKSPF